MRPALASGDSGVQRRDLKTGCAFTNANGSATYRKVPPFGGVGRACGGGVPGVGGGWSPEDVLLFELVLKDKKLLSRQK